ncbi:MAG: efflux RND transporter permease subunit, partial [Candidatus Eisenbacteria sp.]|nr:efflux RND transporter permease subunit [Candidatus Eisenbacteria bacterium]
FMRVVPMVVSLALLASLFEATVMLPVHINDWTGRSTQHQKPEFGFYVWLRAKYERILGIALRRRYLLLVAIFLVLLGAVAAVPLVGVQMFGQEDLGFFSVLVRLPEGTSLDETDRVIRKIEERALQLPEQDVVHVVANTGLLQGNDQWITRKSVGQVVVSLVDENDRDHGIDELIDMLRRDTRDISGITSLEFEKPSGGPPTGKPVSLRIIGKYIDELRGAANDLKAALADIPGVRDIQDDYPVGKQEISVKIDEERAALHGLSPQKISLELRTAIGGLTATTFRDGNEDVDVIVKLQGMRKNSVEAVRDLRLTNIHGVAIPLEDVAEITVQEGASAINHRNLDRIIMVTADIDESVTSVDRAVGSAELHFDEIARRYRDVRFEIGGEFEEFTEAFNNIAQLFAIGIILTYLILGTQFRSYVQPLVILGTVPFAFIGAMVGLLITGDRFGIVTLFGVVALAGIVVNDSIVLVSFINNARRAGADRWGSIIAGGKQRLRPIILTSVTTIGGLLPTVIGIGGSSGIWRPLASTITWGLLFSTVLTLVVIPCALSIVDDIKLRAGKPLVGDD